MRKYAIIIAVMGWTCLLVACGEDEASPSSSGLSWEGYTPAFETDTSSSTQLVYNSYFGFYFRKQLIDTVRLIVPAGSYNTWHFEVDLFTGLADTIPDIRINEYYSPTVGLIRLHLQLQGGPTRTLSLVDIN